MEALPVSGEGPDRADTADAALPELPGIGIRVGGALVAWFAKAEDAHEWARDNHFGAWLAHPCSMPNRPAFTPEQIAEAEREGALLWEKFKPGRMAED
jgi:hypothetical protein